MTAVQEDTETLSAPTARVVCTAPEGSEEWHAARQLGMGGSDIAAALGMNRYTPPLKVYLEKRGELPDLPEDAELEGYAELGHDMQDVIANRWAARSGYTWLRPPGMLAHVEADWMRVNLDGDAVDPDGTRGVLEVKNRSEYQLAEWEDGVPQGPALQAHWGMAVTGYPYAVVAALVGGNKLRWYRIERDHALEANLVTLVADFWRRTLAGVEPEVDGTVATRELLGQLHGVDLGKVAVVDDRGEVERLLAERDRLNQQAKDVESQVGAVENRLRQIAGEAEVLLGDSEDNDPIYTYKANGTFAPKKFTTAHPELAAEYVRLVEAVDTKRLAADHPELYAQFRARVLRVPTPKGATK